MARRTAFPLARKAIDHFTRPDQIEFFPGHLFKKRVVVTDAINAVSQNCVFLLHAKILFVKPILFAAQLPEMQCPMLTDDGDQGEHHDERAKQINWPTLGYDCSEAHSSDA